MNYFSFIFRYSKMLFLLVNVLLQLILIFDFIPFYFLGADVGFEFFHYNVYFLKLISGKI
jgi:hypothetical protein